MPIAGIDSLLHWLCSLRPLWSSHRSLRCLPLPCGHRRPRAIGSFCAVSLSPVSIIAWANACPGTKPSDFACWWPPLSLGRLYSAPSPRLSLQRPSGPGTLYGVFPSFKGFFVGRSVGRPNPLTSILGTPPRQLVQGAGVWAAPHHTAATTTLPLSRQGHQSIWCCFLSRHCCAVLLFLRHYPPREGLKPSSTPLFRRVLGPKHRRFS